MKNLSPFVFCIALFCSNNCFAQSNLTSMFYRIPEEKKLELPGGVKLSYVEQGRSSANTIVFVHGFPDSWHSYEKVLEELPRTVHAFAISLRGFGNSDRPSAPYTIKQFSDDIAAFCKKMNTGRVLLVGHSMGGLIVQRFAIDHPELTKGIVIESSPASFAVSKDMHDYNEAVVQKLKDPVEESVIVDFQASTLSKKIDEQFFATCIDESKKVSAKVWKECVNELTLYHPGEDLKKIKSPALIIWGSKDSFCTREQMQMLNRSIKSSRLLVYEGTGHSVHWEEPGKFAQDIVEFATQWSTSKK